MVGLSAMFPRVEVFLIQGSPVDMLERPPMDGKRIYCPQSGGSIYLSISFTFCYFILLLLNKISSQYCYFLLHLTAIAACCYVD